MMIMIIMDNLSSIATEIVQGTHISHVLVGLIRILLSPRSRRIEMRHKPSMRGDAFDFRTSEEGDFFRLMDLVSWLSLTLE